MILLCAAGTLWCLLSGAGSETPAPRRIRIFVTANSRYNPPLYAALDRLLEVVQAPHHLPCSQQRLRRLLNGSRWMHLHWPEFLFRPGQCADTLANHRALIETLKDEQVRIVWTIHNLRPHSTSLAWKNVSAPEFHAIYSAWLSAAHVLLHHSNFSVHLVRSRYNISHPRNLINYHGFYTYPVMSRAAAESRLGLPATGLRIGVFGSPRDGKQTIEFLRGVARSTRRDMQVLCFSLRPDEVAKVPHDARILAQPYRSAPDDLYGARLQTCDLLAFPIDPQSDLLTSGVPSDALAVGIGGLVSAWNYSAEYLEDAALFAGHTALSVAASLDRLTMEDVRRAKLAAVALRPRRSFSQSAAVVRTDGGGARSHQHSSTTLYKSESTAGGSGNREGVPQGNIRI